MRHKIVGSDKFFVSAFLRSLRAFLSSIRLGDNEDLALKLVVKLELVVEDTECPPIWFYKYVKNESFFNLKILHWFQLLVEVVFVVVVVVLFQVVFNEMNNKESETKKLKSFK